jgi:hypothetical protein
MGRATPPVVSLLKELYPELVDVSKGLSFEKALELTRHWVVSNRDKPRPGQEVVQRWEASPLPETERVDKQVLTQLVNQLGYYGENAFRFTRAYGALDLARAPDFAHVIADLAFVPGGKISNGHWPQLVRLDKLFRLYGQGWRFHELVLQVGPRELGNDELSWQWARDAQATGGSVVGLRFLPYAEILDLKPGSTEFDAMRQLWRIVEKPGHLYGFEPTFRPKIQAWLEASESINPISMMLISVNPHQFQGIINARELPEGSTMFVFYASAELARHDPDYLLDGIGRHWGAVARFVSPSQ